MLFTMPASTMSQIIVYDYLLFLFQTIAPPQLKDFRDLSIICTLYISTLFQNCQQADSDVWRLDMPRLAWLYKMPSITHAWMYKEKKCPHVDNSRHCCAVNILTLPLPSNTFFCHPTWCISTLKSPVCKFLHPLPDNGINVFYITKISYPLQSAEEGNPSWEGFHHSMAVLVIHILLSSASLISQIPQSMLHCLL